MLMQSGETQGCVYRYRDISQFQQAGCPVESGIHTVLETLYPRGDNNLGQCGLVDRWRRSIRHSLGLPRSLTNRRTLKIDHYRRGDEEKGRDSNLFKRACGRPDAVAVLHMRFGKFLK